MTDNNGSMTSGYETGYLAAAQASGNPMTLNFDLNYNADTNVFTNVVTNSNGTEIARTTNFINGTQSFNTGLYPIKFASSGGASTAKSTVSNIEITGSFVDYASIQNDDVKSPKEKINWGETYTYSLGELNVVNGGQTIHSTPIAMENLYEAGSSYTIIDYDGNSTQVDGQKFTTSPYSNHIPTKGTSEILFDLTVVDPKTYSYADQVKLSNSTEKNYATVSTDVTFPFYGNKVISREFKQEISGESSSITIDSNLYRNIDITDQDAVTAAIEEVVVVTDPYLNKLSNEELINSNRYTYSGFTNNGTYSQITVNYLGVNGETVSKVVRVYDYQTALDFQFNIDDETGERKIEAGEEVTYSVRVNGTSSAIDIEGINFEVTLDTRFLTTISDYTVSTVNNGTTDISNSNVHIDIVKDKDKEKLDITIDKLSAGEYIDIIYTTKAKDEFRAMSSSLVTDSIGGNIINIEVDTYEPYGYPDFGDLEAHSGIDLEKIKYTTNFYTNVNDLGDSNKLLKSSELIEFYTTIENESYEVKDVVLSVEDLTGDFNSTITGADVQVEGIPYTNYTIDDSTITLANIEPNTTVNITTRIQAKSTFLSTQKAKFNVSITSREYEYLNRAKAEQSLEIAKDIAADTDLTLSTQVVDETGDSKAEAGEVLTYTATVTNVGNIAIDNLFPIINVEDENLDNSSLSDLTIKIDGVTYSSIDGVMRNPSSNTTIPNLLPNEVATISFSITVKSSNLETGGELEKDIIQEIIIGSDYYDNSTTDRLYKSSTESVPIDFLADGMDELELSHRLVSDSINNDGLAQTNDVLSYELHLDNTQSAINYSNVILTAEVSEGLTDSITNINVTDIDGNTVDFTPVGSIIVIDNLSAGASFKLTYDVTTPSTYTNLDSIVSKVTLISDVTVIPMVREVEVQKDINKDPSFDVTLNTEDADVNLSKAPTTESDIVKLLVSEAIDPIVGDISDQVTVADFGGYDIISPKPGVYPITVTVTGTNNNIITSTSNLTIVDDRSDAVLKVKDTNIGIVTAPTSNEEIIQIMLEEATDETLGDISDQVIVVDLGGYDVDNPELGVYPITMSVTGINNNVITTVANLTIFEDRNDAVLTVKDVNIGIVTAPTSNEEIIQLMLEEATDEYLGDLSDQVTVADLGGYDVDNPELGVYPITMSVTGINNNVVTSVANLTIVEDRNDAVLTVKDTTIGIVTAPTSNEEIIQLMLEEATDEYLGDLSDQVIVSDLGGYDVDNPELGVYTITMSVTGINNNVVTSVANLTIIEDRNDAVLTVKDTTIGIVTAPTSNEEIIQLMLEEATDEYLGDLSDQVIVSDLGGYDVDNPELGVYTITMSVTGINNNVVTTVANLTIVEDRNDAVLTVKDTNIGIVTAPTSNEEIIQLMLEEATDEYLGDLSDQVIIADLGGYDVDNPQLGVYPITMSVTGINNNVVTTVANLTIVEDRNDAVLTVKDANIGIVTAPTSNEEIIQLMLEEATDEYLGDLSDQVIVADLGGYDVDNPELGVYTITMSVTGINNNVVTSVANLTIVEDRNDAVLTVKDTTIGIVTAPTSNEEIIQLMLEEATDEYLGDLSDQVTVADLGGYDVDNPELGVYTITMSVTGINNNVVTSVANLTIVEDRNDAVLTVKDTTIGIVTAPTSNEEIIQLMLEEATDEYLGDLSDQVIVADLGGYDVDNPQLGVYTITMSVTGINNNVVTSVANLTIVEDRNDAVLTVKDINLSIEDAPTSNEEIIQLMLEEATDEYLGDLSDQVIVADLGGYDVDNPVVGVYSITMSVTGINNNVVTSVANLTIVEDRNDAVLTVKDINLSIEDAPTSNEEIIQLMLEEATDEYLGDLSDQVIVADLGGYDVDNPVVGVYSITMSVTGINNNVVTSVANLTITEEDTVSDIIVEVEGNDTEEKESSFKPMTLVSTGNQLILILCIIIVVLVSLLIVRLKIKKIN